MFRLKCTRLEDMLFERDERQRRRLALLEKYRRPEVLISMNIAGEIKSTPAILLLFNRALALFKERLGQDPLYEEVRKPFAGPSALLVYDLDPKVLKEAAMAAEAAEPSSRLLDIDVFGEDGLKLSRPGVRTCLVCGGPAGPCVRSRAHGLDAVKQATDALIRPVLAEAMAEAAVASLKDEARLTPKPGLVDAANNGAHKDMDLDMFLRSAESLRPYLKAFALAGAEGADIEDLVSIGKEAEKAMFKETGGVNTHKGAIYSMGLMSAAFADCAMNGGDPYEKISALAKERRDMRKNEGVYMSHGNAVRTEHRGLGAEAEAEGGMKFARSAARKIGINPLPALCEIMSGLDDTNLLYRGGEEALNYVKSEAKKLLEGDPKELEEGLRRMDRRCIEMGISPGGSADVLACAYYIHRLEALLS